MAQRISLNFEGRVEVEIDHDGEDIDAWAEAVLAAWETLSEHKIADAAKMISHTILELRSTK